MRSSLRDYILEGEADLIVNVVDAANLERNLFLTSQLIDMRIPMIIALTKISVAHKDGIEVDAKLLSERLKVPVIVVRRKGNQSQVPFQGPDRRSCQKATGQRRQHRLSR